MTNLQDNLQEVHKVKALVLGAGGQGLALLSLASDTLRFQRFYNNVLSELLPQRSPF